MRIILLTFLLLSVNVITAQYWQQRVNYRIDITLNDKLHTLDGFERINYINNSPDTLRYIWFHVWPNAYKNDQTAFSDQLLENGDTKFYFSDRSQKGYINRLEFKVNNAIASVEDHPNHIDIIKVNLPNALLPGDSITITTPFYVQLPHNFSRGGHVGESYQVTQWYPKPAVYDKDGWHPMPYLDQGEFYSDFGNYDVRITVPSNYAVAATGQLQNQDELEWLKNRSGFNWKAETKTIKIKGITKKITMLFPASENTTKTLHYLQDNVHDFAWFADKRFIVNYDTCALSSGRIIDVFTFYTPEQSALWKNAITFSKDAVKFYSKEIGEYPYQTLTAVQGPISFGGGMEYPTITVISPMGSEQTLDRVLAHEIGHNWFYGILASNERKHPWLDEGLNSFYERKYFRSKYGDVKNEADILIKTLEFTKRDQPVTTSSEEFTYLNYGLMSYMKAADALASIEKTVGETTFRKLMQDYFNQWKFRHPTPQDFQSAIAQGNPTVDSLFISLYQKGISVLQSGNVQSEQRKNTAISFLFDPNAIQKIMDSRDKHIVIGPLIGFNSHDKLLAGGFISNYLLPPTHFKFFVAPLYATGSKTLRGMGRAEYSFYPGKMIRRVDLSVSGSSFSQNDFKDPSGKKLSFGFTKIAPAIRFIFNENARSTKYRFIQFKNYFIKEERLDFRRDSIFNPPDTTIIDVFSKSNENRTLGQLKVGIQEFRALYPYSAILKAENGNGFIRTDITANYFFNYPKKGGLNVRLFAGKFFYTGSRTINKKFETQRYHLNMTGPNGFEDYTYSDYFLGRNKFEGFASQQIMIRDGGFKIRTDLLADKVGRTDNWLAAINFSTNVPENINPLSLLPVKIPINVFFDLGTRGDAWKNDAEEDRFLYDAGFQFSFFKETVNIYVPLIYSPVFKDYVLSTIPKGKRLLKTISFSIDVANFDLKKIDRQFGFIW